MLYKEEVMFNNGIWFSARAMLAIFCAIQGALWIGEYRLMGGLMLLVAAIYLSMLNNLHTLRERVRRLEQIIEDCREDQ
jgi:hypothetical protein